MSDTIPAPKLTKKQQKAQAFRERRGKGKDKPRRSNGMGMEILDVPAMEDPDAASVGGGEVQVEFMGGKAKSDSESQVGRNTKRDGNSSQKKDGMVEKGSKKKRKLDSEGESTAQQASEAEPKRKKARRGDGEDVSAIAIQVESDKQHVVAKGKERFILFVGNLRYTTSLEAISTHFGTCNPPPSVRLLTPKRDPASTKQTNKSKGCAFLEFTNRDALQQALKLHHTDLDGRIINVELTAGGGGKGENRTKKLQQRNKSLIKQRHGVTRPQHEGDEHPPQQAKSQRYSSTSGLDQKPVKPKTWTVGDVDEGQSKRAKKRAKKVRPLGTGVNAIPVG